MIAASIVAAAAAKKVTNDEIVAEVIAAFRGPMKGTQFLIYRPESLLLKRENGTLYVSPCGKKWTQCSDEEKELANHIYKDLRSKWRDDAQSAICLPATPDDGHPWT